MSIAFDPPTSNGGYTITDYAVVIDEPNPILRTYTTSPAVIDGLVDGVTYTFYIYARTVYGVGANTSHSYTLPAIPGDVSSLSSSLISASSVKVTFGAATSTTPITKYEFAYQVTSNAAEPMSLLWSDTGRTTAGNFDIVGLQENVAYSIYVRAVNVRGPRLGVYSVTEITTRNLQPPVIPTITAVSSTYTTITVEFDPHDDYPSTPITSYQYNIRSSTGPWISFTGSPLIITSGLTQGQTINIYIRTFNSEGVSPVVQVSDRLQPITAPSEPTNISASPTSDATIMVSFSLPADTGGDSSLSYKYSYLYGGNSFGPYDATYPSFYIGGLQNYNQQYTVSLWARNSAGAGPAAQISGTPLAWPSQPTNLNYSTDGLEWGSVYVTWSPPDNWQLFNQITYYVYWVGSGYPISTQSTNILISGLYGATALYVYVSASYEDRTSSPSEIYAISAG
jgi:hypothetical protein